MTYHLDFDIDPKLYRRAITMPIDPGTRPSRRMTIIRNVATAILFPLSLAALAMAFFDFTALLPMLIGGLWGSGVVLAVWWRQHQVQVRLHNTYNETGGRQTMRIEAKGIEASRPFIRTWIDWPFVKQIRPIEGATLIELPTARLIVPDDALSEGTDPAAFQTQLEDWRSA
ncbi:MAG: hypothetical protein AAGG57_16550 [Pseudomonadota bacterium]